MPQLNSAVKTNDGDVHDAVGGDIAQNCAANAKKNRPLLAYEWNMKDAWVENFSVYTFIAEIATGCSGDRQASRRAA
jgi:hypothetical protein